MEGFFFIFLTIEGNGGCEREGPIYSLPYLRVSKMSGVGPLTHQRKRQHRQLPPIQRTRQGQIGFLDIPFHTDTSNNSDSHSKETALTLTIWILEKR